MANFSVHTSVAMLASGFAATGLMVGGLVSEQEVISCFILGTIGGLLPDVDSDSSNSLKIAFTLISSLIGFLVVFYLVSRYSIAELCIIWLSLFLSVRYGVLWIFTRLSVHRGVFHSIPASALFGFGTTAVAYHGFSLDPFSAWMAGAFITFGYLIHLVLDEIYSINLAGVRLKRSFGTALKLFSWRYWGASILLYISTVFAFYLAPDIQPFSEVMLNQHSYKQMQDKLLPTESWFLNLNGKS